MNIGTSGMVRKSFPDFFPRGLGKTRFPAAHILQNVKPSIMAAHPCAADSVTANTVSLHPYKQKAAAIWARCTITASFVTLLSACVTLPSEPGFDDIRLAASERLGKQLQWRDGTGKTFRLENLSRELLQQPLTPDAAVQMALLNNRGLLAAYETLGIAQADLVEATMAVNPVVSGTAAFGPSIEWEAAAIQNVLNLLTLASRKQASEALFEKAKWDVAGHVIQVAAQTRSAYYTAVAELQTLGVWRSAISATEASAELAERQVQAGTLSRLEQRSHQAFYAETLLEGARTELQVRRNREQLNRLMGLWGPATDWQLPERLPDAPAWLPEIENLEARAVRNSFSVAAGKREIEALRITLRLARKFRYLTVLGIGVGTHREPDGQFTGPRFELSLPLFDRGQSRIARLEAQLAASRQRLTMNAIELRAAVREAGTRLSAIHEQVRYFQDVLLPIKQTIIDETQRRYNGMLLGVYDLLQSKQSLLATGRNYVAALRDFWLAWSDLEGIVGEHLMPTDQEHTAPPHQADTATHGSAPRQSHGGNHDEAT